MPDSLIEMSHSQYSTWNDCKRNWAFSKVDKAIPIPSIYAVLGSKWHTLMEDGFKGAKVEHPYFENAKECVQDEIIGVEQYVSGEKDGIKVRGYIDLLTKSQIIDWKFGKAPEDKPRESYFSQLQLYGFLLQGQYEKLYIAFPKAEKVFTFKYDEIQGREAFDKIVEAGKEIRDSKALEVKAEDQEATPGKLCYFCGFRDRCKDRK